MHIIRHLTFAKRSACEPIKHPSGERFECSPWAALTIGGVPREELIRRLRSRYKISSWGEPNRLERLAFETLPQEKEVLLGVFTTEDLRLPDNCKLADVHDEDRLAAWSKKSLKEFGLTAKLCRAETGIHLRLQYTQPSNECLVIAMGLIDGYMWAIETFEAGFPPRFDISKIEADNSWDRCYFVFELEPA